MESQEQHSHNVAIEGIGSHTHPFHIPQNGVMHDSTLIASDPLHHELDTPLHRGDQVITSVTLRRPNAGALRGTSLTDLATLNVVALQKVLPRITTPTLTEQDVANLDPADLIQLGGIFAGFLLTKAEKLKADLPIA